MLKQMRLSIQTWIWQMRNEIRLPVKKSISLATMCLFHLVKDQGMKNSNSSNCQKIKYSGNYWPLKIELFKGKLATYWKYFSSQAIELAKREWVASQGLIGKLCSATEKKNLFSISFYNLKPFFSCSLTNNNTRQAKSSSSSSKNSIYNLFNRNLNNSSFLPLSLHFTSSTPRCQGERLDISSFLTLWTWMKKFFHIKLNAKDICGDKEEL